MTANKAYVLVKTEPQKTKAIRSALQHYGGVKDVEVVTGPYDIVAIVEAPSADEVLDYVMDKIRYTRGVVETTTCFVVETESD